MELDEIAQIYKDNLEEFFADESVMDCICKELYGAEEYEGNKEKYQQHYKKVLEDVLFIPYVRLQDFVRVVTIKMCGEEESSTELVYNEDERICKRLIRKVHEIVCHYTKELIGEIKKIDKNFDINESKLSDFDFQNNVSVIRAGLSVNKDGGTFCGIKKAALNALIIKKEGKESESHKRKRQRLIRYVYPLFKDSKIEGLIQLYEEIVRGKIITETSSYFKHRRDVPNNKMDVGIMDWMDERGIAYLHAVSKDEKRNIHYIFLPILCFNNKKQYLIAAVHEFMHRLKFIEKNGRRQDGFIVFVPSYGEIMVEYALNWIPLIKWSMLRQKNKKELMNVHCTDDDPFCQMEEAVHHWQARQVAENLTKQGVDSLLYMPYNIEIEDYEEYITYELSDRITAKYTEYFKPVIQEIYCGKKSILEFEAMVGYSNLQMLAKLYRVCHEQRNKST